MRFERPAAMTRRPTVSVVIPCYNYGHYLADAVASALDQSEVDVDVLIVDDASTDDSAEVALEIARSEPRVDVLLHEENRGHIRTYNDGLAKVTGDYVTLLSADDLVAPDALSRAVALMERHPRVGLVYGWAQSFEDVPPHDTGEVRNWSVWAGLDWLALTARRGRCFLMSPEAVMRKSAYDATGGYDVRLPHSGDLDMWMRTAAHWDIGRVNGPVQAYYRVHASNMHLTTYAGWLTDLEERRKAFEILFAEREPAMPQVTRLRPAALAALARQALRHGMAAHRDRADGPDLADYRDWAASTWPDIRGTLLWRAGSSTLVEERRLPAAGARRLASRARLHLEWRRRRRYGT